VLRYLRGITDLGLQLSRSTTSQLIAYSDADWAGFPATRRSTSEYCVFLGDNLLTWSSKRQDTLSRSSVEAEYRWVANAVAETSWIRNLLRELHTLLFTATLVYCDNVSAVYMSANPVQHQHTKHIEIDIHFVHDKVAAGHVRIFHVPSRFQYADIFTKGLPYPLFADFRSSLNVRKSPAPTAGHVRVLYVSSPFQYADIFTKELSYPLFADFRSSLSVRKSPAPTGGRIKISITQRQIWGIPGDLSLRIYFPGDMSPGISGTE
ncbi:ribonuclease H-like domain-containing protein, partial [Tanacetum coccineum]